MVLALFFTRLSPFVVTPSGVAFDALTGAQQIHPPILPIPPKFGFVLQHCSSRILPPDPWPGANWLCFAGLFSPGVRAQPGSAHAEPLRRRERKMIGPACIPQCPCVCAYDMIVVTIVICVIPCLYACGRSLLHSDASQVVTCTSYARLGPASSEIL
jgi:hypothetical protein